MFRLFRFFFLRLCPEEVFILRDEAQLFMVRVDVDDSFREGAVLSRLEAWMVEFSSGIV
jgi:hypothetical protein